MNYDNNDIPLEGEPFDFEAQADRVRSSGWVTNPDLALLGANRRPAPDFPLSVIGEFWADWATKAAAAASAPVDYPAVALLASVGAAIANVRWPVARSGWSEPPLLWAALVGSPSSGKSPGQDAAFALIQHAEDEMAAGFSDVRAEYENRKQLAESSLKAWKAETDAYAKSPTGAPPAKPSAAEEPEAPVRQRIRIVDATQERTAGLAAGIPRGLLLSRDELSGWVANFDRYGGNGGDRAFYLEAYGGRPYRVDRVRSEDPIEIRHLSIGVLGTTQPDRLSAITGGADDGLACRFLWCWPSNIPPFHLAEFSHDNTAAKFAFGRLVALRMGADEFGNPAPVRLPLEAAANASVEKFGRQTALRADEASGAFGGTLGKARGHVLRLATILEHLWWAERGDRPEPTVISQKAVVTAAGLVEAYFLPMAERVYGDAAIPAPERGAMQLARYLRKRALRQFNARAAGREIGGDLRMADKMKAACDMLVEAGLIRPQAVTKTGGRPARGFDVHPIVYGAVQ